MKKYYFYLTAVACFFMVMPAKAKDPFFIKQDKYDSWLLTEAYNNVFLTNADKNSPIHIDIQPDTYALKITITVKNIKDKDLPSTVEMDIGEPISEFNTTLTKVDQSNSYQVILQPIEALDFINSAKNTKNKNLVFYITDDNSEKVSLAGIPKAMDQMENFAKNHYIVLPQPFEQKLDFFSTMDTPDVFPYHLYPLFRQQAALHANCNSEKDKKKQKPETKKACSDYENIVNLLKQSGICKKEEIQVAQSYTIQAETSYKWIKCPITPKK